jgi:SAM-dependent methyltransferase
MNFQERIKEIYNKQCSKVYREESDILSMQTGSVKHYGNILKQICFSFDFKISVLDAGCGTGRYFHCLANVKDLLGIDISPFMLEQAREPVKKELIAVENTELLCGDIFSENLLSETFDFIYSIGVLGEYSPFNLLICNKLFELLKPHGILFFTIVDTYSRMQELEIDKTGTNIRILRKLFRYLPPIIRKYVNKMFSSFYMTRKDIKYILGTSDFSNYNILRYQHISKCGWQGCHYDCLAWK